MLKHTYLDKIPNNMVELYSQAELDILRNMATRIKKYDYYIPAAEWQGLRLKEMGMAYDDILKGLSSITGKSQNEIKRLMSEAGATSIMADDRIYKAAGLSPKPLNASKSLQAVLTSGMIATKNEFKNLTRTTARTASRQFADVLDNIYMQIASGGFDVNTAVINGIKTISSKGLCVVQYAKRADYIETAVRRAVITGINQTAGKLQEARADEMNCDLVETTAHPDARPEHAEWQGQVFSLDGKTPGYDLLDIATGYGAADGLCGVNCRHSFYPFFEGLSDRAYSDSQIEDLKAAQGVEYNGQKLTGYEASQKQRYIERQVRAAKREDVMLEAAGFTKSGKTQKWNAALTDFLKQTNLKRQAARTKIA